MQQDRGTDEKQMYPRAVVADRLESQGQAKVIPKFHESLELVGQTLNSMTVHQTAEGNRHKNGMAKEML